MRLHMTANHWDFRHWGKTLEEAFLLNWQRGIFIVAMTIFFLFVFVFL